METLKITLLSILFILTLACEQKEDNPKPEIKDGFSLVISDSITYNSNHIDFYDFSAGLIYLKDGNNFSYADQGTFKVLVDDDVIYTGDMFPTYSSYLPLGPVIRCSPNIFNDYIIPISFHQHIESVGNPEEDPRDDIRILEALKKYNQYKKGLTCEILSIQKLSPTQLSFQVEVTNNDTEALLILDPDKMGVNLFHYFTTGLLLIDILNNVYTHGHTPEQPEPWDSWEKSWFSEINGKETRKFTIPYNSFEEIPSGHYTALFSFPGLSHSVEKDELYQENGRIWLGNSQTTFEVDID